MKLIFLSAASAGFVSAQSVTARGTTANAPLNLSGTNLSSAMQIVVLLTVLTLLPTIITCLTPFLRLSIVFHFLRQALGTQTVPSNQVLMGLSLFLSLIVMQPVMTDMYTQAWQPYETNAISMDQAVQNASVPLRNFLLKFAREKDIQVMLEVSKTPAPATPKDLKLGVLVPAYVLSELKVGFQIGAVLFLPFLIIDLVVASVSLSLGMVQLPPVMISAPFKILLFVVVDGWSLLIGSLMKGLMQP
ncbi:MAG: flagellar type III secretion system pore protein FliP [Acidobacteriota bacterium]